MSRNTTGISPQRGHMTVYGKIILAVLLTAMSLPGQAEETVEEKITVTTYYPSPYGSYHTLQTKKWLVVGEGPADTDSLKDGQLYVEHSQVFQGLRQDPSAAQSKAGEVIYNSGEKMLKFFNGTEWISLDSSSGNAYISKDGTCMAGYTPLPLKHYPSHTCYVAKVYHPYMAWGCGIPGVGCITPAAWGATPPTCNYSVYAWVSIGYSKYNCMIQGATCIAPESSVDQKITFCLKN